jgi:hypothetical protein
VYINSMSSNLSGSIERVLLGTSERAVLKKTNYGNFSGIHISIDSFLNSAGKVLQKKYKFWTGCTQITCYKIRNSKGKFDLLI